MWRTGWRLSCRPGGGRVRVGGVAARRGHLGARAAVGAGGAAGVVGAAVLRRPGLTDAGVQLKQVRRYLPDPQLRQAARDRVTALKGPDTRLGWRIRSARWSPKEALCALTHENKDEDGYGCALVTRESPLGALMIFDRLGSSPIRRAAGRAVTDWSGRTWSTTATSWRW